jgi:hypothetical protein
VLDLSVAAAGLAGVYASARALWEMGPGGASFRAGESARSYARENSVLPDWRQFNGYNLKPSDLGRRIGSSVDDRTRARDNSKGNCNLCNGPHGDRSLDLGHGQSDLSMRAESIIQAIADLAGTGASRSEVKGLAREYYREKTHSAEDLSYQHSSCNRSAGCTDVPRDARQEWRDTGVPEFTMPSVGPNTDPGIFLPP